MPEITVAFAESALRDLADIGNWYAEQDVLEVGDGLVAEVFQLLERLVAQPDMGRLVPEFDQTFLRELIHAP